MEPTTTLTPLEINKWMRQWDIEFSGTRRADANGFVRKVRQLRAIAPVADRDLLLCLPFYLKGLTFSWYEEKQHRIQTWQQFEESFLQRFALQGSRVLLGEEIRRRTQGEPIEREKGQGLTWSSRADEVICWRCGKMGHYARGCPTPPTRRSYLSEKESAPCCGHRCSERMRTRKGVQQQMQARRPGLAGSIGNGVTATAEYAPLGYLQINMGRHRIKGVIDTGSNQTLLGEDARALVDDLGWTVKKDPTSKIKMANGALADLSEAVMGKVEVQGRRRWLKMHLLPELTVPALLGMDFLHHFGLIVDFRDRKWYFREDPTKKYPFSREDPETESEQDEPEDRTVVVSNAVVTRAKKKAAALPGREERKTARTAAFRGRQD